MDFHLPSWRKSVENTPSLDFGRIPDGLTARHWDTPSMFLKETIQTPSTVDLLGFSIVSLSVTVHLIDRAEILWRWSLISALRSKGLRSLCVRVCVCARRTDSACAYECGGAMLKVSGAAPAPSGHEWRFYCSVGVDCSDAEPRCIWLAVLRGISPRALPRPTPITSPRRRGSRRLIQRHRLSWVRDACLGFALEVLAEVRMTRLKCHESCLGWSFDRNSRLECSRWIEEISSIYNWHTLSK